MSDDANSQRDAHGAREGEDLARRQAALRALAENQSAQASQPATGATPSAPSSTLATRLSGRASSGGRRRARVIIGAALVVVVVVVTVGFAAIHFVGGRPGVASAPPTTLRIDPAAAGLPCVYHVGWSPDGKRIAAVGDANGCNSSTGAAQSDAVFIFDALTGKTLARLHPDEPIYANPGIQKAIRPVATQVNTTIYFSSITWTANSQSVLLAFNLFTPTPNGFNQVLGLLRLGIGRQSLNAVWLEPTMVPSKSAPRLTIPRFDLASGAVTLVPAPTTATAYRWNGDGTLSPENAAAGAPIGNPVGGAAFSIWQPGNLQYGGRQSATGTRPVADPQDIDWVSDFVVVSPDGAYCYRSVPSVGSLVPPSRQQDLSERTIAPRDTALLTLAQQFSRATNPNERDTYLIAWRPDGKLLATVSYTQTIEGQTPTSIAVSLYDTASGKLVKALTPNLTGLQNISQNDPSLAWSPDGKRLALIDNVHDALTIWGPGALPA